MKTARISLVTLGVADVARAVRFYEALGWSKAAESVERTAFMLGEGIVLSLWHRDDMIADGGEGALPTGSGSAALGINFETPEAADAFYARAVTAGADPVKPLQTAFWGGYSGNFRDPDGHLFEVAHNPFWRLDADGRLILPSSED
ncbi:VOC family protein [Jiella sp. MQZ9-1]|uniref:VOC family protein n=1 Tax=Jiella flava TaxID=2816857 RepID=A0A939FZ40_9HYPH|nr:VOC family protein [Jiella flava]MCD2470679.1 VOC family protein [Jiella flava]